MKPPVSWQRRLFLVLLGFCVLETIGGVCLGAVTLDGRVIALTCLMSGFAVALGLWWWTQNQSGQGLRHKALRVAFAASGGLAFYANVSFLVWIAGVPIALGTVRDGRMGEHYWLGPFTLVYAVLTYAVMRWSSRR